MSIKRLILKNFVIVPALDIDLAAGFTALTGETGAGKSILLDAIQLLLGARANIELIREGCDKTEVAAEFDTNPVILHWLEQVGCIAEDELFIKRQIDSNGKSKAWINGSVTTAQQLRELATLLVDIHGQHAWQSLLQPASMRELLDNFGKISTVELQKNWQNWQDKLQHLQQLQQLQTNSIDEQQRLQWQISELEKLNPQVDEWEQLQQEHSLLANAKELLDTCSTAIAALDNDNYANSSANSQLSQAINLLQQQQHNAAEFSEMAEILQQSQQLIQEVTRTLHSFVSNNEPDPQRLNELDQRLTLWLSLAKRFQRQPEQLVSTLADWSEQLQQLQQSTDLSALEKQCSQLQQQWQQQAQKISKLRKIASKKFSEQISALMQQLGMHGGKLEVQLEPLKQPSAFGLESVQFLIAGHAGSSPKAINKIASGGELSRIALAISVTSSQNSGANSLIFDEVDAGIGGEVASMVGNLMAKLGRQRQVLCVTHLPQVASQANQQLLVSKSIEHSRSSSDVQLLNNSQRVVEIARMLGGDIKSEVSLAHAKQMLKQTY